MINYQRIYVKRVSSEAECWAHNPKVGGSKPLSAKTHFLEKNNLIN